MFDMYYNRVIDILRKILETQAENIDKAAETITQTIKADGILYVFGSGHSHMIAEEVSFRAGGLVPVKAIIEPNLTGLGGPMKSSYFERLPGYGNAILQLEQTKRVDSIIIVSNSGVNAVPIDMALEAKKLGLKPIAITSLAHSRNMLSRHSSGKRLCEVADIVIDNCGERGDASIEIPEISAKIAPTSTITGCFIINSIIIEVVSKLLKEGIKPPVFLSSNVEGGDEHNLKIVEKYKSRLNLNLF